MTRRPFALLLSGLLLGSVWLHAQGRGGAEWTTSRFDGQRTGSVADDPRISVATMLKPTAFGAFTFLWKLKLEHDPAAATALTQPVLVDRVIGFRGFKSIAFVGTASETVHAIDTDFGVPLWKYHINYSASPPPVRVYADCPGGLTSALSRPTNIAPPIPVAGGRGPGGRGGRSGGGVGEPGRGAITIAAAGQPRGGGAAGPGGPARGAGGGAGQPGAVPGSAAAAAGVAPGDLPAGARAGGGGGRGRGGFTPGDDAAYVVGNDGYLHALNVQNGVENMPAAMFLPANTRASGLIVATGGNRGAIVYAATTRGCGAQPDGVWAMDLASPQKTVTAFQPRGAGIAGTAGPVFGRDGTVYVATTAGVGSMSNTLIALDPTLTPKGSAVVPQAGFNSSPLVFAWQGKEVIAVAGGGKVFLFDAASLASGPVATSASSASPNYEVGALTSWSDASGARWIALPAARGVITMKVIDQGGKPAFAPGWTSRDIPAPLSPLVINGVLFVASSGTRTAPGVLYAMDATSGKDFWNSGKTITTMVQGGLSGGQGSVYVPGADGTLYAFGFAIEK